MALSAARTASKRAALKRSAQALRQDHLRAALPSIVECLSKRRADLIEGAVIDDYVALDWLEWHGGSLRLTVTGGNVCRQLAVRRE